MIVSRKILSIERLHPMLGRLWHTGLSCGHLVILREKPTKGTFIRCLGCETEIKSWLASGYSPIAALKALNRSNR